jgi:hypothetical protein
MVFGGFGLQQSQMIEQGRIGIKLVVSLANGKFYFTSVKIPYEPWSQTNY